MFTLNLRSLILAIILAHATAQVGPQAQQLPACIKTCDPPAIASVNCTNADQYCHCIKQKGIISNISACAATECEDPSGSLYTFTYLFDEVCAKFNISVSVIGSMNSTNTMGAPAPSASVVSYTGNGGMMRPGISAVMIMGLGLWLVM